MSLRRASQGKTKVNHEPRRGTWSLEEDQIIINCLQEGILKWSDIGKKIPNERTGKQCRERWFNHLDPQLKKVPWTDEEDEMLILAQRRIGNSWTRIATEMPGRSENEVKNRWYSAAIRNKHSQFQSGSAAKRRFVEVIPITETEEQKPSKMATGAVKIPLRIPSLFRGVFDSASIGELPNQLLLSPRPHPEPGAGVSADLTTPESSLPQPLQYGDGQSVPGSGLTTPLSFLNGALSGLNSRSGSPAWFEAGAGGIGGSFAGFGAGMVMVAGAGTGTGTGTQTTLSTGSTGTLGAGYGYGSGSDGDTVAEALQLLLQGISTTSSSSCNSVVGGGAVPTATPAPGAAAVADSVAGEVASQIVDGADGAVVVDSTVGDTCQQA